MGVTKLTGPELAVVLTLGITRVCLALGGFDMYSIFNVSGKQSKMVEAVEKSNKNKEGKVEKSTGHGYEHLSIAWNQQMYEWKWWLVLVGRVFNVISFITYLFKNWSDATPSDHLGDLTTIGYIFLAQWISELIAPLLFSHRLLGYTGGIFLILMSAICNFGFSAALLSLYFKMSKNLSGGFELVNLVRWVVIYVWFWMKTESLKETGICAS